MKNEYLVPFEDAIDSFIEKKSEFIGHIFKVETEEDARASINKIREKHKTATHNCYAYIIRENNIMRYSDDGEPQGTAGMPILEVLRREEITNVCVVVTRYFGGIMLGAGGLIRAYAKGAKIAVDAAGIAQMDRFSVILITLPYNLFDIVQTILPKYDSSIENIDYAADVTITAIIKEGKEEELSKALQEVSSGQVDLEIMESRYMGRKIK